MKITTRMTAAVAATLLTAALVPVAAQAAEGSAARTAETRDAALTLMPAFTDVPDSLGLRAPVMLNGDLTDALGAPMRGATVLLSAWPANETVDALPVGATFSLTPLARTTTDRAGRYELRSALTSLIAPLLGRDGLDVQLDVFHAGKQYTWLSQVEPVAGRGWALPNVTGAVAEIDKAVTDTGNDLDIAFTKGQGASFARDLKLATSANRPTHHDPDAKDRLGEPGPHPTYGAWCVERKVAEEFAMTTVATATARKGVTAKVVYSSGARTQTSTGISTGGKGATFSINGQRTREATFGADFPNKKATKKEPVNQEYLVEMAHAVIRHECMGNNEKEIRVRSTRTSPVGVTGGGKPVPSRFSMWRCRDARDAKFDTAHTERARAFTYTRGFSFEPVEGSSFTGEALSGYSDNVRVIYKFKDPSRGFWCGHTSYPMADGQRVQGFQR